MPLPLLSVSVHSLCAQVSVRILLAINNVMTEENESIFRFTSLPVSLKLPFALAGCEIGRPNCVRSMQHPPVE